MSTLPTLHLLTLFTGSNPTTLRPSCQSPFNPIQVQIIVGKIVDGADKRVLFHAGYTDFLPVYAQTLFFLHFDVGIGIFEIYCNQRIFWSHIASRNGQT